MKYILKIQNLGIKLLEESDYAKLQEFCALNEKLGTLNNSSFENLDIDKMNGDYGQYWIVYDIHTLSIVGMAGAHQIFEFGESSYRALFRGCILPDYRGIACNQGLSKKHMSSFIFKYILPLQAVWIYQQGGKKAIITTNTPSNEIDSSGVMFKTDRIMGHLEKQKILKKIHSNIRYRNTWQNFWEVKQVFCPYRSCIVDIVEMKSFNETHEAHV